MAQGFLGGLFGQPQQPANMPLNNMPQGKGLFGMNPEALIALGSGMMQGNMAGGFAAAGDQMAAQREKMAAQQERQRKTNLTMQWLQANKGLSPEEAEMAISDPAILGSYLQPGTGNEYQERFEAAQQYGLTGDDATSFALSGNLPSGRFGSAEVGLQTIWGQGPDGPVLFQPSKTGEAVPTQFPEGVKPLSPYDKSFQTSSGQTAGKGEGEAVSTWRSMSSKMPGLEHVVSELDKLADSATYTLGGQALDQGMRQMGMEPRQAAVDRSRYIAMVDNQVLPLLRDTFGAQFTQKEGEALRATLGDPNKSPKEKQAILKSFIEQKRRDVEALALQTGQQTVPAPGGGDTDPLGIR